MLISCRKLFFKESPLIYKAGPAQEAGNAPAAEVHGETTHKALAPIRALEAVGRGIWGIIGGIKKRVEAVLSGAGYILTKPIGSVAEQLGIKGPEAKTNAPLETLWGIMEGTARKVGTVMEWVGKKVGTLAMSPLTMTAEVGRGLSGMLQGLITGEKIGEKAGREGSQPTHTGGH